MGVRKTPAQLPPSVYNVTSFSHLGPQHCCMSNKVK